MALPVFCKAVQCEYCMQGVGHIAHRYAGCTCRLDGFGGTGHDECALTGLTLLSYSCGYVRTRWLEGTYRLAERCTLPRVHRGDHGLWSDIRNG